MAHWLFLDRGRYLIMTWKQLLTVCAVCGVLSACGANETEIAEYIERPVEQIYNEAFDELSAAISSMRHSNLMKLSASTPIPFGRAVPWLWPRIPIICRINMMRPSSQRAALLRSTPATSAQLMPLSHRHVPV